MVLGCGHIVKLLDVTVGRKATLSRSHETVTGSHGVVGLCGDNGNQMTIQGEVVEPFMWLKED